MNLVTIQATTLPDAWYQAMYAAIEHGRKFKIDRGSYEGQQRLEFDYFTVRIRNPGQDPIVPAMPDGSPLPPPLTEEYLDDYLPYVMQNTPPDDNESYTYGQRIAGAAIDPRMTAERLDRPRIYIENGFWTPPVVFKQDEKLAFSTMLLSQIDLLIRTYRERGHRNNQMCLQVAQPTDMLLRDPPCMRHIDTRIQDGALHFFPYFRSWDLWGGFPANLAAIELTKRYCADQIGVENGEIIAASKGLHLYDHCWPVAEMLRGKAIYGREKSAFELREKA